MPVNDPLGYLQPGQNIPPQVLDELRRRAAAGQQFQGATAQLLGQDQTPPTNSLRSHIGDRGDAIQMMRGQSQAAPAQAQALMPQDIVPNDQTSASGRESQARQADPSTRALLPLAQSQTPRTGGILSGLFGGGQYPNQTGEILQEMFTGFGMGQTPQESIANASKLMMAGNARRAGERRSAAQLNALRQSAVELGLDLNVARGATEGVLENYISKALEWQREGQKPTIVPEGSAVLKGGQEVYKNPKAEKLDSITLLSPNGKTKRTLRVSTEAGVNAFQTLIDQGWTKVPENTQTINLGPTGIDYGQPPKDTAWARNPDGTVMLDDRGVPIARPVQGGERYAEEQAAQAKKGVQKEQTQKYGNVVIEDIGRARKLAQDSWTSTGLAGQAMKDLGGTSAHDLQNLIDTITANVGFDKLQEMRAASPTGGALGQVSDFENRLLQSVLGSLRNSQSKDQFIQNLDRVEETFNQIVHGPKSKDAGKEEEKGESEGDVSVGTTAVNPQTGQRIRWNGKEWEPVQ